MASRIEALGIPGSVLISDKINDEVTNQNSIQTESLGEFKLKNITHPQEVFAVNHPGLVVPNKRQIAVKKKKNQVCEPKGGEDYLVGGFCPYTSLSN